MRNNKFKSRQVRKRYIQIRWDKKKVHSKMVDLNSNISVITSNINGLNAPNKAVRLIKKSK